MKKLVWNHLRSQRATKLLLEISIINQLMFVTTQFLRNHEGPRFWKCFASCTSTWFGRTSGRDSIPKWSDFPSRLK